MNSKHYILSAAIKQLESDLKKDNKEVTKYSNRLANASFETVTDRGRANMRINLDVACEKRDETLKMLKGAKEWKLALNNELEETIMKRPHEQQTGNSFLDFALKMSDSEIEELDKMFCDESCEQQNDEEDKK